MRQNFSGKRIAILNSIKNSSEHPSAAQIYSELKADYPSMSIATVYRNLALFKEQGLVNCAAVVDGEERIDGVTSPHAHFVCQNCKRVIDVCSESFAGVLSELTDGGFCVESVGLTFYGLCSSCSSQSKEA